MQGAPYLKIRIGDFRIIYDVDDNAKRITVEMAGHRRDIYRKMGL